MKMGRQRLSALGWETGLPVERSIELLSSIIDKSALGDIFYYEGMKRIAGEAPRWLFISPAEQETGLAFFESGIHKPIQSDHAMEFSMGEPSLVGDSRIHYASRDYGQKSGLIKFRDGYFWYTAKFKRLVREVAREMNSALNAMELAD